MSLSLQEKKELLDVVTRTGGQREVMLDSRTIPDEYAHYAELVERTEMMLLLPGISVPVRIIITKASDRKPQCPVHINFHGGGFILPQNADDDMYCARVAEGIHGIVVDVDYATTDEYSFPVAQEQCYAVVKWAFEKCREWDADPKCVSVGGHSAGGNLAATISILAAKTGDFELCLQVLDYAANDNYLALTDKGTERTRAFSLLYSDGDEALLKTTMVSPVFAKGSELGNQPPTLIVEAGLCPFTDTNRQYEQMLKDAGNKVERVAFPTSRHGFTVRMLDEWQEAQQVIVDAINSAHLQ